jgi:small-conductance mechanosensitive channel
VVDRKVWGPVFERRPLGFDRNTAARAVQDLVHTGEYVVQSPERTIADIGSLGGGYLVSLGVLGVALLALILVERKHPRNWRRLWGRARATGRRNRLWRSAIAIAERIALPFVALTLWTVGTLLAGEETVPATLIQNLLGIWTGFRLADEAGRQLTRRFEQTSGAALYDALHRLLLFAAWWGAGWLLMDASVYREDVTALWIAGGHLILVVGVFGLLYRRERILQLVPGADTGPTSIVRRVLTWIYYPLIYASLAISLLWVIGYQELASVFLGRSWAVVGICITAVFVYRSVVQVLERWVQGEATNREARDEAVAAGKGLFSIIAWILAIGLSLRALGLRAAVIYAFSQTWFQVGTVRLTGHSIWSSIIVVVALVLISRWLQAMLAYRVYPAIGVGRGEAYALNRLLHYALMVAATLLSLNNLGLSPANIALVLGGLSVGIGFGLQDIANNIASGLILLTSRQVRQGDVISVGERMGTVREVNLRSTMVTTFDNVDLLIPNHKLLGDTLINWTYSGTTVRNKIPFGVSYQADPEEVIALAMRIAQEHPEVLPEPEPAIFLVQMGDNALQFELFVWVDMAVTPRPRVTTQIYCRLLAEFKERGIEVPFPQRDLHVRSGVPWQELIQAMGERQALSVEPQEGERQASSVRPQEGDSRA